MTKSYYSMTLILSQSGSSLSKITIALLILSIQQTVVAAYPSNNHISAFASSKSGQSSPSDNSSSYSEWSQWYSPDYT